MTEGSYTYRHGFKDDYVLPCIKEVIAIKNDYPGDPRIGILLRAVVHEGLYSEYKNEVEAGEVPGKDDKLY
jgi:hypothetical protein